ncbi:MAG: aldehyde:ferredoxin oxidoreductase [Candidatus Eremiobacteraeota bacterium]|nr:aldehyde:ferredoxin oxidoreductase [Candidatus Eremiobacteraeota bacterium]
MPPDAIGGASIAVALLDEAIRGPIDPLGPENVIAFGAGPFAATPVPAATKHAVATISPLTGRLTDGLSSSHWSGALRRLGLAALVIRGASADWTLLAIDAAGVRFLDAREFLGDSPGETTTKVRETLGDRRWRVAAIGIAGENGVRYATIDNDGRQAGRGGSGAVMGAKKLKAIALFAADAAGVQVANPDRLRALSDTLRVRAVGAETAKYRVLGTGANLRVLQRMGMLPARNFRDATFEGAERVTPERARESPQTYLEKRSGCAGCPVQCEHMYVRRGADPKKAAASEYESVWAFGPNCGVDDLDAVLDAIDRCDRHALDTISTGATIAFAMECAEHGLVDTGAFGEALRFGNARVLAPAIEAIARRAGLGETLALGVREAARRIGGGSDAFAMHVKGLELPGYEPRALQTYALGLAVCTRGACHNRAAAYDVDLRDPSAIRSDDQIVRDVIEAEEVAIGWDALVLCKFVRHCFDDFWSEGAALYEAATGRPLDAASFRGAARATWRRKRAINARLGWTPAEDVLPERMNKPMAPGAHAGAIADPATLERRRALYERERAAQREAVVV